MKKLIIIYSILLASCGAQKATMEEVQQSKEVFLYPTMLDYTRDKVSKEKIGVIIKDSSQQHITIKKFINLNTKTKDRKAMKAWGIQYKGNDYFNLGYSTDVNHWKSYAKIDIKGPYSAILVDENSPYILNSTSNYYGGGLTGALIAESHKWNKNWKDKEGKKHKIIIINTFDIPQNPPSYYLGNQGNYLTRKQLKKMIKDYNLPYDTSKIKEISYEKVLKIIKKVNNKLQNN